ncbi:hypothetical protein [Actinomadura luteofluorescens]|uniref:hypothetical protein n=1 Tax=Actinomadura luteofluorescens TaxID=46163 RepID=UPI003D8A715D
MVLLVLPGAAFIIEALKDKPSVELLVLYMALVSAPGLAGAVFLARNGPAPGAIEPPSSPSPPLPPAPPSASSSSTVS